MIVKAFEVRDKSTFIPVLAVKMVPDLRIVGCVPTETSDRERYLLRRSGYPAATEDACVVLCRMECSGVDRNATYDAHAWGGRTFPVAHDYIIKNFDKLESGAVVDVEFLLGETTQPKVSERLS